MNTDPPDKSPAPGDQAGLLGYASGIHFPVDKGDAGAAFREGDLLIALNGTTLPERCVLCGAGGHEGPIRLTFTWDSSFRRAQKTTLELRKKAFVYAYLCAAHRQTWSRARRFGGIGAVGGVSIMCLGMMLSVLSESSDIPYYTALGITLTIAGFAVVIAAMFFFTLRSRTLSCSRIQEGYLYLEGAGEGFVEHLAPLPPKNAA